MGVQSRIWHIFSVYLGYWSPRIFCLLLRNVMVLVDAGQLGCRVKVVNKNIEFVLPPWSTLLNARMPTKLTCRYLYPWQ